MTESEAIARFKSCQENVGRCEKCRFYSCCGIYDMEDAAIEALEEVQQYRKIGTVEECREAVEKQTAKKPIFGYNLSDTLSVFHCECGNTIKVSHDIGIMNNNNAPNYCSHCGCRLDWSDEE